MRHKSTKPIGLSLKSARNADKLFKKSLICTKEKEDIIVREDQTSDLKEGTYCQICFLEIKRLENRVFIAYKRGGNMPIKNTQELVVCRDCYLKEKHEIDKQRKIE